MNEQGIISLLEDLLGDDLQGFREGRAVNSRGYKHQPGELWVSNKGGGGEFHQTPYTQRVRREGSKIQNSLGYLKEFKPAGIKISPGMSEDATRFAVAHEVGHAKQIMRGKRTPVLKRTESFLKKILTKQLNTNPEFFKPQGKYGKQMFIPGEWFGREGQILPRHKPKIVNHVLRGMNLNETLQERFADKFAIKEFKKRGWKPPAPKDLPTGFDGPSSGPYRSRNTIFRRAKWLPLLMMAVSMGGAGGGGMSHES